MACTDHMPRAHHMLGDNPMAGSMIHSACATSMVGAGPRIGTESGQAVPLR